MTAASCSPPKPATMLRRDGTDRRTPSSIRKPYSFSTRRAASAFCRKYEGRPMRDVALSLEGVDKIYQRRGKAPVQAVKALNIEIALGEIAALLGASGCGKTSTLRMIAGFEDVTSGSITLAAA